MYCLTFVTVYILAAIVLPGPLGAEEMTQKHDLIFCTVVYPAQWSETNALLLVESVRDFAGSFSTVPIWCFVPQYGKELKPGTVKRLTELDVDIVPFDIELDVARFFFAADIRAAHIAESTAAGKTDRLVWLGANTIVMNEPCAFMLPDEKQLGYRPVHHTNIGSLYEEPLDPFWTLVYKYCDVAEDRVFPMTTHIDGKKLRPYFNAGILVTRPENGLFKAWHDKFFDIYQKPDLQELYKKDERYVIFIHQALLSGMILNIFSQHEIQELPGTYNYPIHLHKEDITEDRPVKMDDLVLIRHEGFYQDPDWAQKFPGSDTLKRWLKAKLPE